MITIVLIIFVMTCTSSFSIQTSNKTEMQNDSCTNSEDDFPRFFTMAEKKSGAIIVSILVAVYCFTILAIICDKYFLPCVERICETLSISQDVAAATFMASATSAPELFVNIVGTFITQSDIGIGAVVGSSMFNTLGVAALGSLAASSPIQIDWWPVTRDCTLYLIAISMLVAMSWDGSIGLYEGAALLMVYVLYFVIMFNNKRISTCLKSLVEKRFLNRTESKQYLEQSQVEQSSVYCIEKTNLEFANDSKSEDEVKNKQSDIYQIGDVSPVEKITEASEFSKLFTLPEGWLSRIFFFYSWPIKFVLYCIVPNPKTMPKIFPLTFVICILIIGANSYVISWMITTIGDTLGISDTVLGLTLLAAGGSLPEAISIILMSKKGKGSMGVSNALGANSIDILLSLGLPWFIKALIMDSEGSPPFISINSRTLEYTILGLMGIVASLFLTLFFNQFQLKRRTGIILIVVYGIFLTAAIVSEILGVDTLPKC